MLMPEEELREYRRKSSVFDILLLCHKIDPPLLFGEDIYDLEEVLELLLAKINSDDKNEILVFAEIMRERAEQYLNDDEADNINAEPQSAEEIQDKAWAELTEEEREQLNTLDSNTFSKIRSCIENDMADGTISVEKATELMREMIDMYCL